MTRGDSIAVPVKGVEGSRFTVCSGGRRACQRRRD